MHHMTLISASACLLAASCVLGAEAPAYLYKQTTDFVLQMNRVRARKLQLVDAHIHIRGGMTVKKAIARQKDSGITSWVLENFGREWPLSNSDQLAAFIRSCKKETVNGKPVAVGIQVNDRDWFKNIDPAVMKQLDYVLADTMIMGVNAQGKPQRLWLPDLRIDDADAWMERYMAHNLQILDEPISILANPTYLPPRIADQYDRLWTEERMRKVIAKAVEKGIALEVQAGSLYPKPKFLKLAKAMGAKFSFGTNNFDDKTKDLARWFEAIEWLDLKPENLWTPADLKRK